MTNAGDLGVLMAAIGADLRRWDVAMNKMEADMKRAEQVARSSADKISQAFTQAGQKMQSIGKSMSMYVTLPLLAAGAGAFKMAKDFEFNMNKVVTLVGVSRDQVDGWSKDILKMAPRLGKSPKELSDALFFVTSAGLRGAEAMDVLEKSAKASAAGLGETKVVADLVTSAMNAYGVENLNAGAATDILVAAVREGKAEASELAGSMGKVLPIASEMGVSFDQVGAAIAAMTRTGTDANMASTSLRAILTSLYKPTVQAEKALGLMETSSAELRKTIREDGLLVALQKLRELTSTNEEAMGQVIPNVRALAGVLDLMGANADENAEIFDALTKALGLSEKAFEESTQTMEFKWNQALVAGQTALTSLGGALKTSVLPLMDAWTKRLTAVSEWLEGLNENQRKWLIGIGATLIVMGPLLIVLGKMATGIGAVIRMVIGLQGAFLKLTAIVAANPIGAVIVAATLAITALGVAFYAMSKKADAASRVLTEVSQTAGKAIMDERVELEILLRIARDKNKSDEARAGAIKKINAISPQYLGNLKLETIETEAADKAVKAYTESILKNAKAQAAKEKLIEIEKQLMDLQEKGLEGQTSLWKQFGAVMKSQFTGQMAHVEIQRKAIKDYMKTESDLTKQQETLLQMLTDLEGGFEDLTEAVFDTDEVLDKITASSTVVNDILAQVVLDMEKAARMNRVFGASFDEGQAKIQIYTKALQDLVELGYAPGNAAVDQLMGKLAELTMVTELFVDSGDKAADVLNDMASEIDLTEPKLTGMAAVMHTLREETAHVARMTNVWEASYDSLGAQIEVTKNAINAMIQEGYIPGNVALDEQLLKLQELETQYKKNQEAMENASMMQNAITSAAVSMTDALGEMFVDGEKGWNNYMRSVINAGDQIIKSLLAQAIMGMLRGEAVKGLPGLITAAVGIAAIKALFAKHTQGLALGGNVTKSGVFQVGERGPETVFLPAGSAVSPMPMGQQGMGGNVKFIIEDDKLVGVLENYKNKQTYF